MSFQPRWVGVQVVPFIGALYEDPFPVCGVAFTLQFTTQVFIVIHYRVFIKLAVIIHYQNFAFSLLSFDLGQLTSSCILNNHRKSFGSLYVNCLRLLG